MTRFTDRLRRAREAVRRRHRHAAIAAILATAQLLDSAGVTRPPAMVIDGQEVVTQRAVINIWVQIAVMIVAAVVSYALTPKPPQPKPAALQDFDVPTAEEGRPIPVIFGTCWIKGANCLWYGDLTSEPIRTKGGKK